MVGVNIGYVKSIRVVGAVRECPGVHGHYSRGERGAFPDPVDKDHAPQGRHQVGRILGLCLTFSSPRPLMPILLCERESLFVCFILVSFSF